MVFLVGNVKSKILLLSYRSRPVLWGSRKICNHKTQNHSTHLNRFIMVLNLSYSNSELSSSPEKNWPTYISAVRDISLLNVKQIVNMQFSTVDKYYLENFGSK